MSIFYKKYSKKIKVIYSFFIFFVVSFLACNIYAESYIYNIKKGNNDGVKKEESSISTVATPEFTFQSASQILMEASTGKVLYANNENEHLLPASVTKVMTMLLTMEQIDSR